MKKKDSTSKGVIVNHPVEKNALSIHPSILLAIYLYI